MSKSKKSVNPCGNNECNKINAGIDRCIQSLVKALNDAGLETVASCCGHGNRPSNVSLRDGREIIIVPDFESAREVDALFPDIHGNTDTPYHKKYRKGLVVRGSV